MSRARDDKRTQIRANRIAFILHRISDLRRIETRHDGDVTKVIDWWEAQNRIAAMDMERRRNAGRDLVRKNRRRHLMALIKRWGLLKKFYL